MQQDTPTPKFTEGMPDDKGMAKMITALEQALGRIKTNGRAMQNAGKSAARLRAVATTLDKLAGPVNPENEEDAMAVDKTPKAKTRKARRGDRIRFDCEGDDVVGTVTRAGRNGKIDVDADGDEYSLEADDEYTIVKGKAE